MARQDHIGPLHDCLGASPPVVLVAVDNTAGDRLNCFGRGYACTLALPPCDHQRHEVTNADARPIDSQVGVEGCELVARFGEEYRAYERRTPFLLPLPPRGDGGPRPVRALPSDSRRTAGRSCPRRRNRYIPDQGPAYPRFSRVGNRRLFINTLTAYR